MVGTSNESVPEMVIDCSYQRNVNGIANMFVNGAMSYLESETLLVNK